MAAVEQQPQPSTPTEDEWQDALGGFDFTSARKAWVHLTQQREEKSARAGPVSRHGRSWSVGSVPRELEQFLHVASEVTNARSAIEERDNDLKLAAELGQVLLEKNSQLERALAERSDRLVAAEHALADASMSSPRKHRSSMSSTSLYNEHIAVSQMLSDFLHQELDPDSVTGDVTADFKHYRRKVLREFKRLNTQIGVLSDDLQAATSDRDHAYKQVADMRATVKASKTALQDIEELKARLQDQEVSSRQQSSAERLVAQLRSQAQEARHELLGVQQELSEARQELQHADRAQLETKKRISELEVAVAAAKEDLQELTSQHRRAMADVEQLERHNSHLEEEIATRDNHLVALKEENEELQRQLDSRPVVQVSKNASTPTAAKSSDAQRSYRLAALGTSLRGLSVDTHSSDEEDDATPRHERLPSLGQASDGDDIHVTVVADDAVEVAQLRQENKALKAQLEDALSREKQQKEHWRLRDLELERTQQELRDLQDSNNQKASSFYEMIEKKASPCKSRRTPGSARRRKRRNRRKRSGQSNTPTRSPRSGSDFGDSHSGRTSPLAHGHRPSSPLPASFLAVLEQPPHPATQDSSRSAVPRVTDVPYTNGPLASAPVVIPISSDVVHAVARSNAEQKQRSSAQPSPSSPVTDRHVPIHTPLGPSRLSSSMSTPVLPAQRDPNKPIKPPVPHKGLWRFAQQHGTHTGLPSGLSGTGAGSASVAKRPSAVPSQVKIDVQELYRKYASPPRATQSQMKRSPSKQMAYELEKAVNNRPSSPEIERVHRWESVWSRLDHALGHK